MFQWIRKNKFYLWVAFGYGVYTCFAIFLFFIWTFPYDRVERNLVAWIEERTPLHLALEERSFRFPLGFQWERATLGIRLPKAEEVLLIKNLQGRVAVIPLFRGKVNGDFSMDTMGGVIRGALGFSQKEEAGKVHFSGRGEDLDISFLNGVFPDMNVQGKVAIQWDHIWENNDILRGTGSANVNVNGFSIRDFSINGFPLESFFVSTASSRIAVAGGRGTLEEIRINGDLVELEGGGSLLLRSPISNSLLNLDFKALLKGELKENELIHLMIPSVKNGEKIQILARGALRNVQWSINGINLSSLLTM